MTCEELNGLLDRLMDDELTEDERQLLTRPFRFTINFRRQFFQGDTVVLRKGVDESGIFVTGSQPDSEKPSFIVWLQTSIH